MDAAHPQSVSPVSARPLRGGLVALLVLAVAAGHWWTPPGEAGLLAIHVLLRKLFLLPVLLAAIWFNLRGAVLTAIGVTLVYIPHIWLQWAGHTAENINQAGELATVWITAILAGVLVGREKCALIAQTRAFYGVVRALVAALDTREHDTGRHSERVCAYAVRIGEEMRIDAAALHTLALGALLHDIGKIGVPDAILHNPGPLGEEEWRQMREHPELGARILSPTPFLSDASQIVRFHHERFDGSGYPCGLAALQIPLGARIFAVADVYDALTSRRPYREALPHEEAVRHIVSAAGTHFDPEVVTHFACIPASEWRRARGGGTHFREATGN